MLVSDIQPEDISGYQQRRLREGASPNTLNLEVGTLCGILRRHRVWALIQQGVRALLPVNEDVGRAINADEECWLMAAWLKCRSRSLHTAVVLSLNTGMRYSDVRLPTWRQVDLSAATVKVGKSKTNNWTGRTIPLSPVALEVMKNWAAQFGKREPENNVFPEERYGASGDRFFACVYNTHSSKPIGSFKQAWDSAKRQAKVQYRFHDLRHARMLEAGVPFAVVAPVMGWGPATTIRMTK